MKDSILNILYFFTGTDISEELKAIEFGAEVALDFDRNIGVEIVLDFANNETGDTTEIKLAIRDINVSMTNDIVLEDPDKYQTVEELANVGLTIGGYASVETTNVIGENFNFDYLVKKLYGYIFDGRDPELGMQVGVKTDDITGEEVFSQSNYLEIRANANLVTLSKLTNIELYLTLMHLKKARF